MSLLISADYGYGNNQYSTTSYGAQGGADGGGFMGGDVTSSPAGGKVCTLYDVATFANSD